MKLATLVIVSLLGAAGSARADEVLHPPGGAVYVSAPPPAIDPAMRQQRMMRGKQLRRAMLEAFDANGDGRLEPRERMHAIRVLRRIEMRLAAPGAQRRRFIQRYDMNGDGTVGPREMPPAQADRLRRFDRDRDGWVEPREYGQP